MGSLEIYLIISGVLFIVLLPMIKHQAKTMKEFDYIGASKFSKVVLIVSVDIVFSLGFPLLVLYIIGQLIKKAIYGRLA